MKLNHYSLKLLLLTQLAFIIIITIGKLGIMTYQEQLNIISTLKFSSQLLVLIGIIYFIDMIFRIINTAKSNEKLGENYSSIWLPIQAAIFIAFFIPFQGTTSAFTSTVIYIVNAFI